MADTLILRTAHQRQRDLLHRLACDLRRTRLERGVSLRALAAAAGIDHSVLSRIETGRLEPTLSTLVAISTALGMEASVRLFPTTGPRIHDRTSAPITDALVGAAHARWVSRLEVFVVRPACGVIDVVLADRRASDVVASEIQGQLLRVEQHLRWAGQKADSLPSAADWPWTDGPPRISRLLVLRSTATNQALVRDLPDLFRAAYPVPEADAWQALTSRNLPWPGNAMLWAEVAGGRARILDGAPRGSGR